MKLRILDDTIRLRLSQGDVESIRTTGRVEGRTHFAPGQPPLVYSLSIAEDVTEATASFQDLEVAVRLPRATATRWLETDEVGIAAQQPGEDGRILRLLVEKDFKCVVPRDGEQDYDGFPHPDVTC